MYIAELSSCVDYSNVCDERLVLQLKDEIDVLKREKETLSSDADR